MHAAPATERKRYPIPGRLNLTLTLLQAVISLGLLAWASQTQALWAWVLAAVLFSFIMQMGFSLLHEAEHHKLHPDRRLNDLAGWLCATLFPGSYQLMTVAHLNHHRVNRSDAELVDYIRPGEHPVGKTLQYYALICGLIWLAAPLTTLALCLTPTRLLQCFFARRPDSTVTRYLAFIQRCGVQAVRRDTLFAILFWIAAWHLLALTLSGVALCYAAFAFSWSSQQYVYHVRTPRHLIEGAYDLKLWAPLRWLYLNFNYHLSHHRAVAVPWLYMPEVAREQPRLSYLDRYLSLWQPPQPVDQAWPVEHQARGPLLPPSIPTTAG